MFKKLLFTIFLLISSFETFAHQDNQAALIEQEALLLSSLKNFNRDELLLVKEYTKSLKKVTLYTNKYFSLMTNEDESNPALVPLRIKGNKFGLIVATLKSIYPFIHHIHVQLCALSSLVQNERLAYEYEIFPFDPERESLIYIASLTKKMLDEIRKLQTN